MKRLFIKNTTILLLIAILVITALPCGLPDYSYATTTPPEIESEGGIVIDMKTGEILYSKNIDNQFEPASMTKMMTCILTCENLQLTDVVTIDRETSFTGGSRIYLIEDEQITVQNLLYALMLESANDAAVALAKAVAGSVPDFAAMMNAKAKEIGCTNTNFVNPNGLHEEGHLSTPRDMALIAQYAMQYPVIRELVTTYKYTIPETNKQPERYMYNTNRLIYDRENKVYVNGVLRECKYDGCFGIKTGYTPQAGGCLASAARSYDTEIISVVMHGTDMGRFADTITLFDWTFANYHSESAVKSNDPLGVMTVKMGAVNKVPIETSGSAFVLLPAEASSALLRTEMVLDETIEAPIAKGQKVGRIDVYAGDEYKTTVDVVASAEVERGTFLAHFGIENKKAYAIIIITGFLLAVIIGTVVAVSVAKARRRKARRLRREQRAMEIAKERAERERDQELRDWFFK